MSLAATTPYPATPDRAAYSSQKRANGAQVLLGQKAPPPNYTARGLAVIAYTLALGAIVTLGFKPAEAPPEELQAVELAPIPVDEQPPEDVPDLAQPETLEPPPPEALDPIAPVDEVKPEPKPIEKPKPERKVEKKIDPAPQRRDAKRTPSAAAQTAVPAVHAPPAPAGATPSAVANQLHACLQRGAANSYPESQAPRSAHIAYRATFSATGSLISFSITPSGNAAFDAVANRLGGRCGVVAAPGKTVAVSGSLTFSAN